MIEFKFACTRCGQHIQANDAYSGMQIVCPTCKNQIIVPQAPPSAAVPRSGISIASPPPISQNPAPLEALPPPLPAKGKSKTTLVAICGVVGLVLIGAAAYAFLLGPFSRSSDSAASKAAKKPMAEKLAGGQKSPGKSGEGQGDSHKPSAAQIVEKVIDEYDSLSSFSASGKSVSIIDMSGVDMKNVPGVSGSLPREVQDSKEFKQAIAKPQRLENEFTLKLGKPDFYRVEWEGQMGPAQNQGAVWSSGAGDFLLMARNPVKYVKMQNREMALASATGVSGGVAGTMPAIFFKGQSSLLNLFKNPTRGADESIDGEECYVLNGNASGMKMILWINKSNFLIKQKQTVLGGKLTMPEMTDDKIQEGLKQLGGQPTPQQEAQSKAMMKNMQAMASQMKGTMTETYQNIEINQPVTKEDFNYKVPAGTKLSSSLF